jgi:hypothetical protein
MKKEIPVLKAIHPFRNIVLSFLDISDPLLSLFPSCNRLMQDIRKSLEDNGKINDVLEKINEEQ